MAGRERRIERSAWLMRRELADAGAELRNARLAAGLTLRDVADAIGVSASFVLKCERGLPPGARPEVLATHAAAVGMRARIRVYPDGEPLRDAAQLRLLARLRERIGGRAVLRAEQPVTTDPADRRAFDAVLELPGCRCAIECISRLHDCQAQLRQLHLKQRDGGVDRLIVVVGATRHNRPALREIEAAVAPTFPLDTRQVLRALRDGRDPGANGIILL